MHLCYFQTALHYASYSCNITSVTWLLDRGALVNFPNLDLQTPLHVAVQSYPAQSRAHFEMKTTLAHVLVNSESTKGNIYKTPTSALNGRAQKEEHEEGGGCLAPQKLSNIMMYIFPLTD